MTVGTGVSGKVRVGTGVAGDDASVGVGAGVRGTCVVEIDGDALEEGEGDVDWLADGARRADGRTPERSAARRDGARSRPGIRGRPG